MWSGKPVDGLPAVSGTLENRSRVGLGSDAGGRHACSRSPRGAGGAGGGSESAGARRQRGPGQGSEFGSRPCIGNVSPPQCALAGGLPSVPEAMRWGCWSQSPQLASAAREKAVCNSRNAPAMHNTPRTTASARAPVMPSYLHFPPGARQSNFGLFPRRERVRGSRFGVDRRRLAGRQRLRQSKRRHSWSRRSATKPITRPAIALK